MAVHNLYSKRRRRELGEVSDVYQYDTIPPGLRVQITYILQDVLETEHYAAIRWEQLHNVLAREYQLMRLTQDHAAARAVISFLQNAATTDQVLDIVELTLKYGRRGDYEMLQRTEKAIDEMNARFRENGVGYAFESDQIVRVDSQLLHRQAVKPVLNLLADPHYRGANEEFLRAHEHYRHDRFEEAIGDAFKAFESTLKLICEKRNWTYSQNDTAKVLLEIVFKKGLVESFWQAQFSALRSILESGTPTVRNKRAGHGRGAQPRQLPQHLSEYVLNLTASGILFLIESEKALP